MLRSRPLATATAVAALAFTALVATPAQAAGPLSVTSPACGTVMATNTSTAAQYLATDDFSVEGELAAGKSITRTKVPAGSYVWQSIDDSYDVSGQGRVTVAPCSSSYPRRPVDGDQNGDNRADVLGIQATTGKLFYYQMTDAGLANGIQAGTGWNSTLWMQQVNQIEGAGTGNYLLAMRNDGTLWRYPNLGSGRFGTGQQIGSGFQGYKNFTVLPLNNGLAFGAHVLLASTGATLKGYLLDAEGMDPDPQVLSEQWSAITKTIAVRDFDADSFAEVITIDSGGAMRAWQMDADSAVPGALNNPYKVGSGWGAMGIVTSPGSLNQDWNSDLVSRRNDGNLYKYLNKGGRWAEGVQIGRNWNGVRLLA